MNGGRQPSVPFPHDTSYRYLLSSKKLFVELLRSFVSRGWVEEIDATELEAIDHSFVLPDFRRKEADLVYRLRMKNRDIIFYLLLELQSTVDMAMPYRLLQYQMEIWRYLQRNRQVEEGGIFTIPAIVPIVLYNGQRPWTAPRQLRALMEGEQAFGPELLNFEYLLIDVERYTEQELLELSNTIGAVFLLDQTADRQQLHDRLGKLMGTVRAMSEDMQSQFLNWLANMVTKQLPNGHEAIDELVTQLKLEGESTMGLQQNLEAIRHSGVEEGIQLGIAKGIEQGRQRGLEEGLEKGLEQGLEQAAHRMILLGLDDEVIMQATGIAEKRLRELRKQTN
ncbi:Rpn family recombination-promoting nuclease/putative transposase [Cohnella sp. 56]|uniref:Rpn family recombination-promoting nuclease/putative transposase n=1 Tax=Cohnella sp. 56 TaxID=3113722 RepID=UPI0030EA14A6